jgi:hypothetical protein
MRSTHFELLSSLNLLADRNFEPHIQALIKETKKYLKSMQQSKLQSLRWQKPSKPSLSSIQGLRPLSAHPGRWKPFAPKKKVLEPDSGFVLPDHLPSSPQSVMPLTARLPKAVPVLSDDSASSDDCELSSFSSEGASLILLSPTLKTVRFN